LKQKLHILWIHLGANYYNICRIKKTQLKKQKLNLGLHFQFHKRAAYNSSLGGRICGASYWIKKSKKKPLLFQFSTLHAALGRNTTLV
jgi:hypothetical protein